MARPQPAPRVPRAAGASLLQTLAVAGMAGMPPLVPIGTTMPVFPGFGGVRPNYSTPPPPPPPPPPPSVEDLGLWPTQISAKLSAAQGHVGSSVSLIKPVARALNKAKHPKTTITFLLVSTAIVLSYWYKTEQYMAELRKGTVEMATLKCLEESHPVSCRILEQALGLKLDLGAANHTVGRCDPGPPPLSCAWTAGAAVRAAGFAELALLSTDQTVDVYGAMCRQLPTDACHDYDDTYAFVREQVDLNRDGSLSRFEVFAGLPRLLRRAHWRDALADELWSVRLAPA